MASPRHDFEFEGIREMRKALSELGRTDSSAQREVNYGVAKEVRGVIRTEFETGVGPEGEWQHTVRGKPALVSRKLKLAFQVLVIPGGIYGFFGIAWLEAQHQGHTFRPRSVAANTHFMTFNRRGRFMKLSRVFNKKGEVKRGVFQTFARAHVVRERVLPARPLFPESDIPPSWGEPMNRGAVAGLRSWAERAGAR